MKKILLFICILGATFTAKFAVAQNALFLRNGRIEFERKLNLYAQNENDDEWSDLMKKSMPQFKTNYFNLYFNNDKTIYKPGKENPDNNKLWEQPAEDNTIYQDLQLQQTVSQKRVFEQVFLITDSARKIQWKITDEMRTIAGVECRRANAIIMDSIYVVAFYADAIPVSSGPESFTGLPGMILGVAIPHEHITFFATRIYNETVTDAMIAPPVKGKKVNNTSLKETIDKATKDWGKFGKRYVKAVLL